MVTYVNRKCHNCGKSLTGGYTQDYNAIGIPFLECKKCHALNSHEGSCTEWELMSIPRKTWFLIQMTITSIFWALALAFVLFLFLMEKIEGDLQLAGLAAFALTVCGLYRVLQFKRLTRASRRRMSNESYRNKLRELGFLST